MLAPVADPAAVENSYLNIYGYDITGRKRMEMEREAAVEFLHLVNQSSGTADLVRAAAAFFQEKSGCEAVGIRLKQGEDYPYFEARGFSKEFVEIGNSLCSRDEAGNIVRDSAGDPYIECMCGSVICGGADPSMPFFSPGGSFWTNSTTRFMATAAASGLQTRVRNRCNEEGYESVALIPLNFGAERTGLLQLNDRREGMFSPEIVAQWERLAGYLAVALAKSRADQALREARDELDSRVRQRTAELSEANEELGRRAALLDLAHDAILVRDMDNKIRYWNDGAEKVYGWTKEEALGKTTHTLLRTRFPKPLDDLEAELLTTGEWRGELGHTTKNGERITVSSRWALRKGPEGDPSGLLEINRDITRRKRAEREAASYLAKIEETNRALQDFVSIASHDLQEPLYKVNSFGALLKQKYGGALGEQGKDYLDRMVGATARMQSLLSALLEYSRLSTKADLFVEVELAGIVREVLGDLELRTRKAGAEVLVGDLPVVKADPTQMRQLFQNLIGNALKFQKDGGKPVVKVFASESEEGGFHVTVEDNGIGMEQQYLERIFAPFQRLHGRSSRYTGTGMGLAICRKIVERHGWSISVKSAPGEGTSFIIQPAAEKAVSSEQ